MITSDAHGCFCNLHGDVNLVCHQLDVFSGAPGQITIAVPFALSLAVRIQLRAIVRTLAEVN